MDDVGHRRDIAGRHRKRLLGDHRALGHALQDGIDGGEKDRWVLAADNARQPRKRHDPLRDDRGMRRDAVVGQAIPGWEFQDFNIGREEGNRPRDRSHAWAVAADER